MFPIAMFLEGGQTMKQCFLAMFLEGGQTMKQCFLAMFPEGEKYVCFARTVSKAGQTAKHSRKLQDFQMFPNLSIAS